LLRDGFLLIDGNLCASCVRPVSLAAALSAVLTVGTVALLLRLDELDNLAQGPLNLEGSEHGDICQVCSLRKDPNGRRDASRLSARVSGLHRQINSSLSVVPLIGLVLSSRSALAAALASRRGRPRPHFGASVTETLMTPHPLRASPIHLPTSVGPIPSGPDSTGQLSRSEFPPGLPPRNCCSY
jgi:hypothetical protein